MYRNIKKYLIPENFANKIKNIWIKFNKLISFIINNCDITGNYFSSDVIHVNSIETQRNWAYLYRQYEDEKNLKDLIQRVRLHTMVTYDGLATTYNVSKYVIENSISGALVETGTCMGGSAAVMCAAIKDSGESREIHLFDSFEGLPNPQQIDYEPWMEKDWALNPSQFNGAKEKCGALISSKADAEHGLFKIIQIPNNLVTFHVGWFEDTIPEASKKISEIAILRLDGDLYESTIISLRNLYPLVVRGGVCNHR